MKKKNLLVSSIFLISFYTFWYFPAMMTGSVLLLVGLLVLIFPHLHQIKSISYTYISFSLLQEAVNKEQISMGKALAIITRELLFPFFLTVYLVYLFIAETHFQNMHFTRLFLSVDEYFLFCVVLLTGVCSLRGDIKEKEEYRGVKITSWYGYICYAFSLLVVGVGMWQVRNYAIELGWMRHVLSSSTGLVLLLLTTILFQHRE